jgi:hypothetical protein
MEPMREVLRTSLGRSLRELCEEDRLAAAWTVACGPAMAERGAVAGYEGGVVRVEVVDAVWMRQMMSLRGVLEREVGKISGLRIAGIHFELKTSSKPASPAARESATVDSGKAKSEAAVERFGRSRPGRGRG